MCTVSHSFRAWSTRFILCVHIWWVLYSALLRRYRNHGILCHLKFVNAREYNNLDILACDKIDSNKPNCNISTERIEKMVIFRHINVTTKLRILKIHRCKSAQDAANIQRSCSNSNSQIKYKFYLNFVSDFIAVSEILYVLFYRSRNFIDTSFYWYSKSNRPKRSLALYSAKEMNKRENLERAFLCFAKRNAPIKWCSHAPK